ncbi:MAG: cellulose biosynthesis protein BcsS, partial [bacterium]
MRGIRVLVAAAVAAAAMALSASTAAAQTESPAAPTVLFFSGTDLWRQGQFVHGGVLLSPAGLDAEGFTLKLLIGGGDYRYHSGAFANDVEGRVLYASAMPGWRFRRDAFIVTVYGGLDA